jgi:WD40 repeat protein
MSSSTLNIKLLFALILIIMGGIAVSNAQSEPDLVIQEWHETDVVSLCFVQNDNRLVLGDAGGKIILWDLQTKRQVGSIQLEVKIKNILEFSDGRFGVVSLDKVQIYSSQNLKFLYSLPIDNGDNFVEFDDRLLYRFGQSVKVLAVEKGAIPKVISMPSISKLIVSDSCVLASTKNKIYQLKSKKGEMVKAGSIDVKRTAGILNQNSSGQIITKTKGGIVNLRAARKPHILLTSYVMPVFSKAIRWGDMRGNRVVLLSNDHNIYVLDEKLKDLYQLTLTDGRPERIEMSAKGNYLAVASKAKVTMYDLTVGREAYELDANASRITSITKNQSKDGMLLGFSNGGLRLLPLDHTQRTYFTQVPLSLKEIRRGWRVKIDVIAEEEVGEIRFSGKVYRSIEGRVKAERNLTGNWDYITNSMQLSFSGKSSFTKDDRLTVKGYIESSIKKNQNIRFEKQEVDIALSGLNMLELKSGNSNPIEVICLNGGETLYRKGNNYYATKNASNYLSFTNTTGASYRLEQFDPFYNRPGLVFKDCKYLNSNLINLYDKAYDKRLKKLGMSNSKPDFNNIPQLDVMDTTKYNVEQDELSVRIEAKDNVALTVLHVNVNGVPMFGKNGKSISGKSFTTDLLIKLSTGVNKIEIFAANSNGIISNLIQTGHFLDTKRKQNLFLIGVGVSKYEQNEFDLDFAAKDANDIISKFERKLKGYRNIKKLSLVGKNFNSSSLEKMNGFLKEVNEDDVVIFYYAGHGVLDANLDYYLCPFNMDFSAPQKNGVLYEEIENTITKCKSRKKIILLDACHSGEIDKDELTYKKEQSVKPGDLKFRGTADGIGANDQISIFEFSKRLFIDTRLSKGNLIVTSSSGAELSMEGADWDNGLFTHFVLSGLESKDADLDEDGTLSIHELIDFVSAQVSKVSGGKQNPTIREDNRHIDIDMN